MYHVELRQFPHNHARFNLSDGELVALIDPWVREQWVELGERKWNVNQATITILEGPQLPVQRISMGRGWRTAQREGQDVTERVLARANAAIEQAAQTATAPASSARPAPAASSNGSLLSDPLALGVQIASLLGSDPSRLLDAWRSVSVTSPGLAPSESLALAEQQLTSAEENAG